MIPLACHPHPERFNLLGMTMASRDCELIIEEDSDTMELEYLHMLWKFLLIEGHHVELEYERLKPTDFKIFPPKWKK